jgi:hypothetical protein
MGVSSVLSFFLGVAGLFQNVTVNCLTAYRSFLTRINPNGGLPLKSSASTAQNPG